MQFATMYLEILSQTLRLIEAMHHINMHLMFLSWES